MKISILLKISFQNLKNNYKGTFLSILWLPLSFIVLIASKALIMPNLFGVDSSDYIPYLIFGLFFWQIFTSSVTKGLDSLSNNLLLLNTQIHANDFIKIKYFEIVIIAFLNIPILFILCLFYGSDIKYLNFLFITIIYLIFFFQCSKFFSIVGLHLRDISFLIKSSLVVLFFLTPIFWYVDYNDPTLIKYLNFNILFHFIEFYRNLIFSHDYTKISIYVVSITFFCLTFFNILFIDKLIFKSKNFI